MGGTTSCPSSAAARPRHPPGKSRAAAIRKPRANVFTDLGFAAEETEQLRIRADLMIALTRAIDARGLSQAAAANDPSGP